MDASEIMRGLEAAGRLAALSPQTQAQMIAWNFGTVPAELRVASAFRQIGRAIASKRSPVADRDLKRLFAEMERLLKSGDTLVANAVATDTLEAIWEAAHESGFDFSTVDPHLGAETRRYLLRWDDFHGVRTPGFTRR